MGPYGRQIRGLELALRLNVRVLRRPSPPPFFPLASYYDSLMSVTISSKKWILQPFYKSS